MNEVKGKVNGKSSGINGEKEGGIGKESCVEGKIDRKVENEKDDMGGINKDMVREKNEGLGGDSLVERNMDKE